MSRTVTQDNLFSVLQEQSDKIERLERALAQRDLAKRVINVTTASSVINLGDFDGDNISGVRISLNGLVLSGTNTGLRLRPNGSTAFSTVSVAQLVYNGGASHATVSALLFGGVLATGGLAVAATHWTQPSTFLTMQGIFYTPRLAGASVRVWDGSYTNRDATVDASAFARADLSGQWSDTTTVLSSITLALDAGTFTGRITTEVIP